MPLSVSDMFSTGRRLRIKRHGYTIKALLYAVSDGAYDTISAFQGRRTSELDHAGAGGR